MADAGPPATRRLVGFVMAGSAGVMGFVAALVLFGVIDVAEPSRRLVGGVLGVVAAVDLLLAAYLIVSDTR